MDDKEAKRPKLSAHDAQLVGKAISGKLKNFYDEIAAQEVPDRFKELLDRLDKQNDK